MADCGCNKLNVVCDHIISARCVPYKPKEVYDWSNLTGDERCDTTKDALDELYKKTDEISKTVSLAGLSAGCISITPSEGSIRIVDVFNALIKNICSLESSIADLKDKMSNIGECPCIIEPEE